MNIYASMLQTTVLVGEGEMGVRALNISIAQFPTTSGHFETFVT